MLELTSAYNFEWGDLYSIQFGNELGINAIKKLNLNQEESLIRTIQDFEKEIQSNEILKNLDPELQGSYYMQFFEGENLIIKELQRQQRYALVMTIYSFFEGRLKSICELIEKKYNFKIKLEDLNNSDDLMKYWKYLEKVYEMEMDSIHPTFTIIKQQKVLRNIITHHEGNISINKLKKIQLVNGLSINNIGAINKIELDESSYVNFLLKNIGLFLEKLLLAVDFRFIQKII